MATTEILDWRGGIIPYYDEHILMGKETRYLSDYTLDYNQEQIIKDDNPNIVSVKIKKF